MGVNESGYESGNDRITEGRSLPWLQDTPDVNTWSQWSVRYRDVLVRDGDGLVFGVFNLTDRDLSVAENYNELLDLALSAAEQ